MKTTIILLKQSARKFMRQENLIVWLLNWWARQGKISNSNSCNEKENQNTIKLQTVIISHDCDHNMYCFDKLFDSKKSKFHLWQQQVCISQVRSSRYHWSWSHCQKEKVTTTLISSFVITCIKNATITRGLGPVWNSPSIIKKLQ